MCAHSLSLGSRTSRTLYLVCQSPGAPVGGELVLRRCFRSVPSPEGHCPEKSTAGRSWQPGEGTWAGHGQRLLRCGTAPLLAFGLHVLTIFSEIALTHLVLFNVCGLYPRCMLCHKVFNPFYTVLSLSFLPRPLCFRFPPLTLSSPSLSSPF